MLDLTLASVATLRVRNLALAEEAAERCRLARELELAREIQIGLVPTQQPQPAGYALHAMTVASRGVSGDLYKVIERDGGRECVLVVADVSGKGIGAALLAASLEALLSGPIDDAHPPDEICGRVSQQLYERTPANMYATAFVGVLDAASGRLRYSSAGHGPALVIRASRHVERLATRGMPLGLFPGTSFPVDECTLNLGDALVLYTDGITDATNDKEREYGIDGLIDICKSAHDAPVEEIVRQIERDLNAHVADAGYADDRTVLVVRRFDRSSDFVMPATTATANGISAAPGMSVSAPCAV